MVEQEQSREALGPVQAEIPVYGLMPSFVKKVVQLFWRVKQPEFRVVEEQEIPDNLEQCLPRVAEEMQKRPWVQQLIQDVHDGKKSAVFKVSLGVLVIFAAAGAGFEFGVRGGKDIRELHARVNHLLVYKKE